VIRQIQKIKGNEVRVGKLRDAPAAFHLGGFDYLNLDHEVVRRMNDGANAYDQTALKSYVLGLLRYDLH
jgi:hypothetical protein